ncbi:hypothetical protein NKI86_31520 [Mesorhizobium sp. M0320]|uniref:hypothetical protein n=1 Tax=Mesorhizobium sp. M0320 TaxID=2956936 RepID=UPI00333AF543
MAVNTTISPEDMREIIKSLSDMLIYEPARRWGKTLATQQLTQAKSRGPISGAEYQMYRFDEWPTMNWSLRGEVAKFDDPKIPAATITIYEETLDKDHPRNPNPQAGPLKVFQVYNEKRKIGQPFRTLPLAKAKAKNLHQRLVDAIIETRQKANPLYGMF